MKKKRAQWIESPTIRSYRELLGVDSGASPEILKKAYKRLAALYHPDRNSDPRAADVFLKVTKAFEALSNTEKIHKLNQDYLDEKLFKQCIFGLNICFGSFFGFRQYELSRVPKSHRIGVEKQNQTDAKGASYSLNYDEDCQSITDSAAYDSIELVYAGKFDPQDEVKVMGGIRGAELAQLPWITLNNQGIYYFLEGKFEDSLDCYIKLNDRIKNNIIFLYRQGLLEILLSFQKSKGIFKSPDKTLFKKGVSSLRNAIAIGEMRTIGKQKCITIRKTLADAYELAGLKSQARKVWRDIYHIRPESLEAQRRLQGPLNQLLLAVGRLRRRA